MSYKAKILHCLKHGVFSPNETKEIADYVGCTLRTAQIVTKEYKEQTSTNKLTIENYIKAILSGADTKQTIAEYLGVNRRSLLRFENKNILVKTISRYLYVAGVDTKTICHLYRLTEEDTAELRKLPTIAGVKKDLRTISAILYPFKSSCEEIDDKHESVNKILREL